MTYHAEIVFQSSDTFVGDPEWLLSYDLDFHYGI